MKREDGGKRPVIVPLGGFLGAGKTTLILAASRILQARGIRPAAILNDQGSQLVDTRFVRENGVAADQVEGGCFCCRFSEFIDAAARLRAYSPGVIFAEAVGSCADVSATTLQPLKLQHSSRFRLAPYSVLVDPQRACQLSSPAANDSGPAFLFHKQIEEADLICFTKADVSSHFPDLRQAPVRYLSALTGQGVAPWLDEVLWGEIEPAGKILEIDYERYARAEAALAWLNLSAVVKLRKPLSPAMLIGPLLDDLDRALMMHDLQLGHLKLMDEVCSGYVKASLTMNGQEPTVDGDLAASPAAVHELLLNIRAAGEPAQLQTIVEKQVAAIPGKLEIRALQCFSPAEPQPEWRLSSVVKRPD